MAEEQNFTSLTNSDVDNIIQQEVGRNQGQVIGQMTDSQAVSAQEIGVFVSGGSVVFQNSGNGGQSKSRPIPSLLPYLPNRSDQEFELGKAIKAQAQQSQNRPLICIIHGDEFQSHDKFLERLRKVSLPRLLRFDATKMAIKSYPLPWSSGIKDVRRLPEYLCKNLADVVEGYSFASIEDINQTFLKYPDPIIVHTHLLTEDWNKQGSEILVKLLEFWNDWPKLSPGQQLFVCIFIKYQIKRHKKRSALWFLRPWALLQAFLKRRKCCKLNQEIHRQVEEIAKSGFTQFSNVNGVVLSQLSGISRTHVENWVRAEATKAFVGEAMLEQLINSVREIFDQWELQTSSNTMAMDDLAEQLIKLLKSPAFASE